MSEITLSPLMHEFRFYREIDIAKVEARYNVRYVGEFPGRTVSGGWSEDIPVAIFWRPEKTPPYTNTYLGIHRDLTFDCWKLSDADYVIDCVFPGSIDDHGHVIYSRFRHDYIRSDDERTVVDGGWNYFKSRFGRPVHLRIVDDRIVATDEPTNVLDRDEEPTVKLVANEQPSQ